MSINQTREKAVHSAPLHQVVCSRNAGLLLELHYLRR